MKITKKKIGHKKIAYNHYKANNGLLVKNNNHDINCTCEVMRILPYKKSFLHKLIKFDKPQNKQWENQYLIVEKFLSYLCGLNNINENLINELKKEFSNLDKLEQNLYPHLKHKGKNFYVTQNNEHKKIINLIYDIIFYDLTLQNTVSICEPMKKMIEIQIEQRKNANIKSIENNKIPYVVKNGQLVTSSNYSNWIETKLLPTNANQTNYNLERIISNLLNGYKINEFVTNAKKYFSEEDVVNCYSIKNLLTAHEKDILSFDKNTTEDLRYIINEVRNYIATKFPLKNVNKNLKNSMYENNSNKIKENYFNLYINEATIKNTIKNILINKLNNIIISKGKLIHYYGDEIQNGTKTYFTSTDLQKIKLDEAVKKHLLNSVSSATFNLSFIFDYTNDKDLLIARNFSNSLRNINENNYMEYINRLDYYYSVKSENLIRDKDDLEIFLRDIRTSINSVRCNTYHYKKDDLHNILCSFENNNINIVSKNIVNKIFEKEKELVCNKIYSMNLHLYYDKATLEKLFKLCKIDYSSLNIPFTPSFKKVYIKGKNIQNSTNTLINRECWFKDDFNNKDEQNVYKNTLQLIYNNHFLSSVIENESMVLKNINTVINNNKKLASKTKNRFAFKYSTIPTWNKREDLETYFSKIQSMLMTSDDNNTDALFDFIHDLYAFTFNKFLLENYDTTLKTPNIINNETVIQKNKEAIKNILQIKEIDSSLKNNFGLYLFLLLQNNENLNSLINQFKKLLALSNNDIEQTRNYIKILNFVMLIKPTLNDIAVDEKDTINHLKHFIIGEPKNYSLDAKPLYFQADKDTPIKHRNLELFKSTGMAIKYEHILNNKITMSDYDNWIVLSSKIDELQATKKVLHDKWIKDKKNFIDFNAYKDVCTKIGAYNNVHNKLHFNNLYTAYKIHLKILSRLIGYINDFERDLFFYLKFLEYSGLIVVNNEANVYNSFRRGNINKNLKQLFELSLNNGIRNNFIFCTFLFNDWGNIRNKIAHNDNINIQNVSIIDLINDVRKIMKYDRKRKNAVTKSIIDIFEQFNIDINFTMEQHIISAERKNIKSKKEKHLGGKILIDKYDTHMIDLIYKLINYKK